MESEDEISLLSPDWEEDFCESGIHLGLKRESLGKTDSSVEPNRPPAKQSRVVFADVLENVHKQDSKHDRALTNRRNSHQPYVPPPPPPPPAIRIISASPRPSKHISHQLGGRGFPFVGESRRRKSSDDRKFLPSALKGPDSVKSLKSTPAPHPPGAELSRDRLDPVNGSHEGFGKRKASLQAKSPDKNAKGPDLHGCLKKSPGKELRVAFSEPIATTEIPGAPGRSGAACGGDGHFRPLGPSSHASAYTACVPTSACSSVFCPSTSVLCSTSCSSTFGKKTSAAMSFSPITTFATEPGASAQSPLSQNIELSTLKFADSPSVDDSLSDWFLATSSSFVNSSSTGSQSVSSIPQSSIITSSGTSRNSNSASLTDTFFSSPSPLTPTRVITQPPPLPQTSPSSTAAGVVTLLTDERGWSGDSGAGVNGSCTNSNSPIVSESAPNGDSFVEERRGGGSAVRPGTVPSRDASRANSIHRLQDISNSVLSPDAVSGGGGDSSTVPADSGRDGGCHRGSYSGGGQQCEENRNGCNKNNSHAVSAVGLARDTDQEDSEDGFSDTPKFHPSNYHYHHRHSYSYPHRTDENFNPRDFHGGYAGFVDSDRTQNSTRYSHRASVGCVGDFSSKPREGYNFEGNNYNNYNYNYNHHQYYQDHQPQHPQYYHHVYQQQQQQQQQHQTYAYHFLQQQQPSQQQYQHHSHHHHNHPHQYHHQQQQQQQYIHNNTPCSSHPAFNSDRRLPDFVTIDQCYRGTDETECSTICLIAQFDSGTNTGTGTATVSNVPTSTKEGSEQQQHHQQQQQQQQQQHQQGADWISTPSSGQHLTSRRGGPVEPPPPPRKERVSLRRGIMMRQMSLNPTHEQDIHAIADIRSSHMSQPEDNHHAPDSWEPNNVDSTGPRRLSTCSFSRHAVHPTPPTVLPMAAPPVVLVDGAELETRRDSSASLGKDVAPVGNDSLECRRGSNVPERQPCLPQQSPQHQYQQQQQQQHQHQQHEQQPQQQPQQGYASPGTKMKMKNLGLSNAASAMRFRLTFDETADAAANKNIELPPDVNPQVLTTKRPSCICGEPELPPAGGPFLFSQPQDKTSGGEGPNHHAPPPPHTSASDSAICGAAAPSLFQPQQAEHTTAFSASHSFYAPGYPPTGNAPYSPSTGVYPLKTSHSSIPYIETLQPEAGRTPALVVSSPSPTNINSELMLDDPQKDNNISTIQTQNQTGEHPKVTICISNSQQSFIPFTCDSPTFESGLEENSYNLSDFSDSHYHQHSNHINNNNQYGFKDGSSPIMFHAEPGSSAAYHNSLMMNQDHPDFDIAMVNGTIPMETSQLLANHHSDSQPLLPHQDTVSAPPIQDLYRYHVFFSHCPEDREWVEHMVAHLEAPPFNYTCAYASLQDEADPGTLQQRILCAAMLSERVVLVLSSKYVQDTWFSFEKTLKQLTQMSLHNQRIMGVLLEDCEIPESLGELYFLDSSDPDFFHVFTKRLKTSRIPRSSASVSSDLGQNAVAPASEYILEY
ncbi:uncharacterized protein LOC101858280 [Aplysia californica]|uniref:Uncharacterized protein LOC101858280 n=1 Tax=Aplysia californica TaxID=6500 RepID=A0ABM1A1Y8_APLCA|nr:uncharacterized protein LOC101858280 [Aplysia californica]